MSATLIIRDGAGRRLSEASVASTRLPEPVASGEPVRCLGCGAIIAEREDPFCVADGALTIDCRHCKTANVFSETGHTRG